MPLISADVWSVPLAGVEYRTVARQQSEAHPFEIKQVHLLKTG